MVALLSIALPGLGQWYLKRKRFALISFTVVTSLLVYGAIQTFSYNGNTIQGLSCLLVGIATWVGVLFHSFFAGRKADQLVSRDGRQACKDPFLAIFLSYLLPGLGQIYVRDYLNGIAFIALFGATKLLLVSDLAGWVILGLSGLSSYFAARRVNDIAPEYFNVIMAVIISFYGIAFFKAGMITVLKTDFYTYEDSVGPSMEPTMPYSSVCLVNVQATKHLQRGDIVSCEEPGVGKVGKRLVAFGGETVEIKQGGVYVNGKRLTTPPFDTLIYISDSETVFGKDGNPFRVPKGSVYVLGDNSRNSEDSRYVGPVGLSQVYGVVYKIIFPFKYIRLLLPPSTRVK